MKSLLRLLLKSQHQRNRLGSAQTEKGMTLVELLVGAIMAFLIITPMIGFVVDMLNTDRREQVKSNTEQDIQAALDFIAQDLSQAIYIYDNNPATTSTATTTPTGIPAILNFIPPPSQNQTPILVFWKRQLLKNSLPIRGSIQPIQCKNTSNQCNDTYVLSLVAYYKITDSNSIWCQPSGPSSSCPSRIVRYQIQDGVRNPYSTDPAQRYYPNANVEESQRASSAFNIGGANQPGFDISKPTENVTAGSASFANPDVRKEVLVNYIDHSPGPAEDCTTALGNPTTQTGSPIPEPTLKITDAQAPQRTNSFYACVDTARNVAKVTIRGNSLRRIQTDANYAPNKSAYFPTASVLVQGLGARGQ